MYCSVYGIGGISAQTCKNAITDGVEACKLCNGHGRESYPDPLPECGCGRSVNHSGTCSERQTFFDAHRQPTDGEMQFIKGILKGKSPVVCREEADLAATTNPDAKAHRLINLPHIRKYLGSVLDKAGATDRKIASVIAAGLDATDIQIRMEKVVRKGETTETPVEIPRPDWQARLRAVEIALRAKGFMDRDDGTSKIPTKVTIVNKFSRKAGDEEDGNVIEVSSAG